MSQRMEALARATEIRDAGIQARKELRAHCITLAQALADERTAHLPVNRLLCSMQGWGPVKTDTMLMRLTIVPSKQVGALTERQRGLIVEAVQR